MSVNKLRMSLVISITIIYHVYNDIAQTVVLYIEFIFYLSHVFDS